MKLILSQWIYFCIFCFSVVVMRPSFAQNEACSLTGYWVDDDPEGDTGEWELIQVGKTDNMKATIKQIICSVLYYTLLFTTDVSIAQDNDQPVADQIAATQFFQTIAIHEVNGFKTKQGKADRLIEKKVVQT